MLAAVNRGRQVVLDQIFFFARPEAAEHENGLAHARFAKLHAFAGGSDAKPIGPKAFEGLGYFGPAVAVTVAFDDRKNFCAEFRAFRTSD